jgi:hypothetical protein
MSKRNIARTIRRRVAPAVAAMAVAGGAVATMATPASAYWDQVCTSGPGYVNCISINPGGTKHFKVHLGIDIYMSRADAQAIIDAYGEEFSAKVIADDPVYDNALFNMPVTWSAAWDGGLSAEFDLDVWSSQLNEDNGYFEGYLDEVFANIKLYDPRTGVTRTYRTANDVGYF